MTQPSLENACGPGQAEDDRIAIEHGLARALPPVGASPHHLHRAMHDATFPGGRRIRPRLAMAAARAARTMDPDAALELRAACSIELVHCASLVHDDLPCFDDAHERRGRPAVHVMHGEATALLVGDALLALAFESLAQPSEHPERALELSRRLAMATGSRFGIIGGQSLESKSFEAGEPVGYASVRRYHDLKTVPLFRIATELGALASGVADPDAWGGIGHWLGAAFQIADDLYDLGVAGHNCGKPVGRDAALGRPNAARALGHAAAFAELGEHLARARSQARAVTPRPQQILAIVDEIERALEGRVNA